MLKMNILKMNIRHILLPAVLGLIGLGATARAATPRTADGRTNTPPAALRGATAVQGFLTMAPGLTDRILMRVDLQVDSAAGSAVVKGLTLDLSGSTRATADLSRIRAWRSPSTLFYGPERERATLIGSAKVRQGRVSLTFSQPQRLPAGTTSLFLTADVRPDATVGHEVDATLCTVSHDGGTLQLQANPAGKARIFKRHAMLFSPYDKGSHYWRIPAMIVLRHQPDPSRNGRILTVTDMRHNSNFDLPNKIDLIARHSDDGGLTWTDGLLIAGNPILSPDYGYGDAALVETASGRIVCLMAADRQFQGSSAEHPIRYYQTHSDDGGLTWSVPAEITAPIYAHTYAQGPLQGGFTTSGRGLLLERQTDPARNGRILFAMVCKFKSGKYQNYTLFSDDEGLTWRISAQSAYDGGDEAKLAELPDGSVLLSTRRGGNRGFNRSADGGNTWGRQYENNQLWGASCNADILVYSDSIVLHTLCHDAARRNLTLFASTDGGRTFPYRQVICQLGAAYSTLEKLPNGDVAVYFEDNSMGHDAFHMNFVTLPLSWLLGSPDAAR